MVQISRCFDVCCAGFANQLAVYALLSDICTKYDLQIDIELSNELNIQNCDEVAKRATILGPLKHLYSLEIEHSDSKLMQRMIHSCKVCILCLAC